MNKSITSVFLVTTMFSLAACQPAEPEIEIGEVKRIISFLSSDDMEGRRVFTPGIEKASIFLQGEFEKIGLETLDGLDTYEQRFKMFSLEIESADLIINGNAIEDQDYFAALKSSGIDWDQNSGLKIEVIGADGNIRDIYGELRNADENVLVLVDKAHEQLFGRYKQFLSGSSYKMELKDSGNLVFILTDEINPKEFSINITANVSEISLSNIVGKISGKRSDEIVLFSAHYDHIGIRPPIEGDSIANGANDDASGTTAVVSLAKYFSQMEQPERTLIFVAFTAEERGGYGSRYFSQAMNPDNIVAMFNIEMIGKGATEGPNTAWITGFDKSDFGKILQKAVGNTQYEFYADPYPDQNLFYRSDNATLARLGVPAHSISTTPIDVDPDYHQVSDEVETLDIDHMTNTIKAIAKAAATIVSGQETPSRVDPADVN